jgi:hypothetical protein
MATGAANMRALARQVESIPDESVAELVRWFVPRSEVVGGRIRFAGRIYQLSSRIRTRKGGRGPRTVAVGSRSIVILGGTPAGAWAIKSYGRRGGYDVKPRRREALKLSAFAPGVFFEHVTVQRPTHGDRRWDRLVAEANIKFPDVVAELVDRRVVRV